MNIQLADTSFLTDTQKQALNKGAHAHFMAVLALTNMIGRFTDVEDVLDVGVDELASRSGLFRHQAEDILQRIASKLAPTPQVLSSLKETCGSCISTGDGGLDHVLGGGIRTGLLWEFAGERYLPSIQCALDSSTDFLVVLAKHSSCSSLHLWSSFITNLVGLLALVASSPRCEHFLCNVYSIFSNRTQRSAEQPQRWIIYSSTRFWALSG